MKKLFFFAGILLCCINAIAQDHYKMKYSLGQSSYGKWYKLMNIDLNGNGQYNSINITVNFHYVNTFIKYNATAVLRLRENSTGDWQHNAEGINKKVLKLKEVANNIYELWGFSAGNYGHLSFTSTVTKEAPFIMTIPSTPIVSSNIDALVDVPILGDWYFSSGKIEVQKEGTFAGKWNPNESYFTLSNPNGSSIMMDTNEIYSSGALHIGSKSGEIVRFRAITETSTSDKMVIKNDGKVGIGTMSPDSELTVKGNIHAEEIKIDLSVPAPDYVFTKEYDLLSIEEVQQHIANKGHLPNIPSAKEMEANGVELGVMNMKLLEKIEELTLYTIEQEKRIKSLEEKLEKILSAK
ncbi:tail fiber protein [Aquimarina brevivitae]|uniref:Uncharacterized protein n=1 Tax=Aquimarina brevivitae TaxID=323412 RepID=A0A4Q7NVW4_9FLAO|nr:tail fiber protein [Aquimarina brevivitae]RZS90542.1 hypothetical protein EV197_3336 [Aquimarina brevivitae]